MSYISLTYTFDEQGRRGIMKIREGFVLRQIADQWMVVPIGGMAEKIHGLISLNETAADIWKILEDEHTVDEVVDILALSYEHDRDEIRDNVLEFIHTLEENDMLDK